MNLFLVGWKLPEAFQRAAADELHRSVEVYPQLDGSTVWSVTHGPCFAGSVHHPPYACGSRRYVARNERSLVFYDGCAVDSTHRFKAADASELAANWDILDAALEGQYCAVRLSFAEPRLEVITDFLGMAQVYYCRAGDSWLVSNSVRLLASVANLRSLDPLGVSLMLSLGWVSGDVTLTQGVRIIPGGVRWVWSQEHSAKPHRQSYFLPRTLATLPQKWRFSRANAATLRDKLAAVCSCLEEISGSLECPITGGQDSRVLVSLLAAKQVSATYYTDGIPGNAEAEIASQIAGALRLNHRLNAKPLEGLRDGWDGLAACLVAQNDGLVSLWQVADVSDQPSNVVRLPVCLWGIGGEIGRRYYATPEWYLVGTGDGRARDLLSRRMVSDANGLIRPEAVDLAATHVRNWFDDMRAEGFRPMDIPDAFYTYERVRRWAGSNSRKSRPVGDIFSPFCTRPFVEAAFPLHALYRYSEPIHYEILRLSPLLHRIPFQKEPWRPQMPGLNLLVGAWRKKIITRLVRRRGAEIAAYDQHALLDAIAPKLRTFCRDQESATLWQLIDRSKLDRLLGPDVPAQERRLYASAIYGAVTLCYYASMS